MNDESGRARQDGKSRRVANTHAEGADPLARHAWLVDRRRQFRDGRGYTRFVDAMKLLLPAAALMLVVALVLYSALYPAPGDMSLKFSDLKAVGEHLEMTKPFLTFTDKQSRAFQVQAKMATQLPGGANHWQLATIQATMQPPNEPVVHLTSQSGVLDSEQQLLDLAGNIVVVTEDGRRFEARTAHVNFGKGEVTSEEPVRAIAAGGTVESNRFRLTNSGKQIHFEDQVRFKTTPKRAPETRDQGTPDPVARDDAARPVGD